MLLIISIFSSSFSLSDEVISTKPQQHANLSINDLNKLADKKCDKSMKSIQGLEDYRLDCKKHYHLICKNIYFTVCVLPKKENALDENTKSTLRVFDVKKREFLDNHEKSKEELDLNIDFLNKLGSIYKKTNHYKRLQKINLMNNSDFAEYRELTNK